MVNPDEPRPRVVTPRLRGYVHRVIIAVSNHVAVDEFGELIEDPAKFASDNDGHIWIVDDPVWILTLMVAAHGDHPDFNYQIVTSEDDEPVRFVKSRITRFGFRCKHEKDDPAREACPYRRRRAMHSVWCPSDLSPTPGKILTDYTHVSLLELATDIRDWCKNEGVPLPSTLAGIANSLLRDSRFWPDARGRVPKATNENVRKFLPGVYSELRAPHWEHNRHAIALDQKTAYHVAAQETPIPESTTLFARGYFNCPDTSPIWCIPSTLLYQRTVSQPGIVYVQVSVYPLRKSQVRPPAVAKAGRYRCALYTNELELCQQNGVTIEGITAAWTSTIHDTGLPLYGAYAQQQITEASEYRKRWLKPTLHALYGLLGTRPRRIKIGHLRGRSLHETTARIGFGNEFPVRQADLGVIQPMTTNVAALGTLQAEIRTRSLSLARQLMEAGATVLHIHADGLHVEGDTLPLIPSDGWKVEPLTRLIYMDKHSWISDEGDCLPGRDERARVETIRHSARIVNKTGTPKQPTTSKHSPVWTSPEPLGPPTEHGYFYGIDEYEHTHPLYWPDGKRRHYVKYKETPRRKQRGKRRPRAPRGIGRRFQRETNDPGLREDSTQDRG